MINVLDTSKWAPVKVSQDGIVSVNPKEMIQVPAAIEFIKQLKEFNKKSTKSKDDEKT